jgi:hypothetical protein
VLRLMEVRVKYNVRSPPRGPANGLWIPPAFVADRDTERQGTGAKNSAASPWRICALFRGVDLNLVLKPRDRSVGIDHQGGCNQCSFNKAFRSEHDGHIRLRGRAPDRGPGAFEKIRIGGWHALAAPPIARHEALRKANDARALDRRLINTLLRERDRLIRTARKPNIGKRDSKTIQVLAFRKKGT